MQRQHNKFEIRNWRCAALNKAFAMCGCARARNQSLRGREFAIELALLRWSHQQKQCNDETYGIWDLCRMVAANAPLNLPVAWSVTP